MAVLFLLGLASACSSGDLSLEEADPLAAPLFPTFEQVNAIVRRECAPCHNSSADRTGERRPGSGRDSTAWDGRDGGDKFRSYETCEEIAAEITNIIDAAVEKESMPPGAWPRLQEREKLIITRWAENGACAPCNPCN